MNNTDMQSGCSTSLSFKSKDFKLGESSLVLGPKITGKTSFVINQIYGDVCESLDELYVFSQYLHKYSSITDKVYDIKEFNFLITSLKQRCSENKNNPQVMIIIDNGYISTSDFSRSTGVIEVLMNGRHLNLNITFVLVTQDISLLPSKLRNNIDNIIVGNRYNRSSLKRIYEYYFGMYDNYNIFKKVYDYLGNYEFLINTYEQEGFINISRLLDNHHIIPSTNNLISFSEKVGINERDNEIRDLTQQTNMMIDNLVNIRNRLKSLSN